MKIGEKIAIFLGALLLTLVAFNLIATQAVDILKIGKQAGYEIIVKSSAELGSPTLHSHHFLSRKLLEDLLALIILILGIALIVSVKKGFSGRRPKRQPYRTPSSKPEY
jgi:hypothetical protein